MLSTKTRNIMNAADILAESRAPGHNSVYFLGCFESRVTVYAQQVRALNLASALVTENQIRPNGKVAIVGGGAAGMTVAAALIALCPQLQNLILFERKSELLHLQMQSRDRYLHPHLYDWPRDGSLEPNAGLPILDWTAGVASSVASTLELRFKPFQEAPFVQVRTSTGVAGIIPVGSACRLSLNGGVVEQTLFDAAVVSAGFGYEKYNDQGQPSYWDASSMVQPLRNDLHDPEFFISGTGDGALVDFSLAAYNHIAHEELCRFVVERNDLGSVKLELLAIEAEAESAGDAYDLLEAYRTRVANLLPDSMLLDVHERLRADAKVRFHSRSACLFRRNTSILNRFLAFLAIWADGVTNSTSAKITVTTGLALVEPEFRLDGTVHVTGEVPYKPYARFLRFGTDTETLLLPFEPFAHAANLHKSTLPNTHVAATPVLTSSASRQYEALKNTPRFRLLTSIPADVTSLISPTFMIDFRECSDGSLRWSGDAGAIAKAWTVPRLGISCNFVPGRVPKLSIAVSRLLTHTNNPLLISPDKNDWERKWKRHSTPTPSPYTRYGRPTFLTSETFDEDTELPEVISEAQLADLIHLHLDKYMLEELNTLIVESLDADSPRPYGWATSPGLRRLLQIRWSDWFELLGVNPPILRRFLVLMASDSDTQDLSREGLVRVGMFTLQATILRGVLFSLHITEALSSRLAPGADFPGNFSGDVLRAHACGVAWIDGIDISASFRNKSWKSRLILLSELQSPSSLTNRFQPRLDESDRGEPSLMREAAYESAVVVSCDDSFRMASSGGKEHLVVHMEGIFGQLTADAERSLERREDA
jgi:hypothetical protein